MTLEDPASSAFVVDPSSTGARLDRFLRDRLELGRRDVWDLLDRGAVSLVRDERPLRALRKSELLRLGDRILVELRSLARAEPDSSVIPPILFESDSVVVCEKAAGLPSGALRKKPRGNLAAGLLARYPEMAELGHSRLEPGLIHRLDTWTSGLLIAARTGAGFESMKRALALGTLSKEYLAVVALGPGGPRVAEGLEFSYESDLEPDPKSTKRVLIRSGTRFRTEAQILKVTDSRAVVLVRAQRAYRHQIRVHLAELGLPLVGDETYESPDRTGAPRHALHAHYVASRETPAFRVRSPLPPDLAALVGGLGSTFDSSD